jgi:chromosome segregation protein
MLTARERLDTVIEDMNGIMVSRFRDMFHNLSEAFNASFRRLFDGGSAALILSDAENILETGVELSVELPGKKVANHNLLSGGEKSLIGIALMFAMLTVRPTPFCVMDEVDAALDEANIDRFTAYLRDKADRSQFVMISHRYSTMEAANVLWGVTMEEEGVSKVLSVRLEGERILEIGNVV